MGLVNLSVCYLFIDDVREYFLIFYKRLGIAFSVLGFRDMVVNKRLVFCVYNIFIFMLER